mmetsp:Transcript_21138/g.48803  ORF Transcript_21138/g.48803 Transcript_21138/m.48803 type:complete len:97 (+) Transcript_21138:256-546(+)
MIVKNKNKSCRRHDLEKDPWSYHFLAGPIFLFHSKANSLFLAGAQIEDVPRLLPNKNQLMGLTPLSVAFGEIRCKNVLSSTRAESQPTGTDGKRMM